MTLRKANGVVENLQVVRTKQNILHGPQMQEAAGVSAIVFGLAGMAGAAVQTAINADGGADDVDVYSFEIDGVKYAGVTRGISVKNGDEVELVYEVRSQGNEVLAVRRPSSRSIWLYPYTSRGSRAGVVQGMKLWMIFTVSVFLGVFAIALVLWRGPLPADFFWIGLAASFGSMAIAVGWMVPRLLRFARAANEVFAVFGYTKPKWVDLQKTSKAHRKANGVVWSMQNNFELWY